MWAKLRKDAKNNSPFHSRGFSSKQKRARLANQDSTLSGQTESAVGLQFGVRGEAGRGFDVGYEVGLFFVVSVLGIGAFVEPSSTVKQHE